MKRVLFTHSNFLRFDPKQWETGQPYPPLGTLYAAALVRANGFETALHDVMFSESVDEIDSALDTVTPDYLVIYDDGFNYLTKMCLTNMRDAALETCARAKQKGCRVIVSSSDATDHFEKYLNSGADFVLLGEAEHSLLELLQTLSGAANADLRAIAGIAFVQNGVVLKTQKRPVLRDLDSLPLPAWDLVDLDPYRSMWMQHNGYFSINISTTRGCPFKCNWCAKPIYGNRYNARSPEHVVQELVYLQSFAGFNHIWFCDDIFGLKPGWVQRFAELVQAHDLRLRFRIQSRADLLLQEDYVHSLARAGCENVWIGAESGSQAILDAMDKGITVAQIHEATLLLRAHNILPSFFIQFGYPGETKKDIRQTIRMINRLLPHSIGISVSYPLPGTPFYENVKNELSRKANWTDSDDLHLLFRNSFGPAFYRQLHQHVHASYRKHLSWQYLLKLLHNPMAMSTAGLRKAFGWLYYLPKEQMSYIRLKRLEKRVQL